MSKYRLARPVQHGDTEQAPAVRAPRLTRPVVFQVGNNVKQKCEYQGLLLFTHTTGICKQAYHGRTVLRKNYLYNGINGLALQRHIIRSQQLRE